MLRDGSQCDRPLPRLVQLQSLIASDARRMHVLGLVRALGLPDCWVAAGFVRSRVWDHVHQYAEAPLPPDVDVIWFDPERSAAQHDAAVEKALHARDATVGWSVKNQARMHLRNGDPPYRSATDAMRYWPETATAVGVRLDAHGHIEVSAPFGLDDLFALVVRPSAHFRDVKPVLYRERLHAKQWQLRWPRLTMLAPDEQGKEQKMNLILEQTDQVPWFTDMREVFQAANIAPQDYDWYLSDIETNWTPPGFSPVDQWFSGDELASLLDKHALQFIWAVFSAVPRGCRSTPSTAPYAHGNPNYWTGTDPGVQLEGALFEIACWDSSATILIHLPPEAARAFVARYPDTRPLGNART